MKGESVHAADGLRDSVTAFQPDPRNQHLSLDEHHEWIALFKLADAVPQVIRVHFETAKNLWLYAWFAYRFHPVAEGHALATLEFALRERLFEDDRATGKPARSFRGLHALLNAAIVEGLVRVEGLRAMERIARNRAEHRMLLQRIAYMREHRLQEMSYETTPVELAEADRDFDLLGLLLRSLPRIRNDHAHGSSNLHSQVSATFEVVTDLLNQLFCEV